MAYSPTEWSKGDVITAEKLNKLENGVAGGGGAYIVNAVTDEDTQIVTLDKTFLEIETAYLAGKSVLIYYTGITYVDTTPIEVYYKNLVCQTSRGEDLSEITPYIYLFGEGNFPHEYYAESLDGYPYYDPND